MDTEPDRTDPPAASNSLRDLSTPDAFASKVASAFRWQASAQALGQVITWLSTLVVIRLLSSEDYGLLAMAGVLTNFFFLVADMGVGAASVQAKDLSDNDLDSLGGLAIVTNVGGFALALPAAPLLANYFREPALVDIVVAQAVAFLFMSLYVLPQSQLIRSMNFRQKAQVDSLGMVASAGAAIAGALLGFGVWALVSANLTLHLVRTIGYRRAANLRIRPRFTGVNARRFLAFGLALTLDRLLFFAFSQSDVILGGRILGSELLGVYTVAMSIAVIPLDKIIPVINQVAFAAYSRIQADTDRVRRSLRQTVRVVSFGAFPVFLGLAAVAPDFVPVVLGDKWSDIILPMQLLSLMLPLKAVASVLPPALYGTGQPFVSVVNLLISLVILVVALLVGAPYGIIGMCLAWVVSYPLIFVVTTARTARAVGSTLQELLGECAFPLAASLVMAGATVGTGILLAALPYPTLRLLAEVLVGIAVYLALVALFNRAVFNEALALARR